MVESADFLYGQEARKGRRGTEREWQGLRALRGRGVKAVPEGKRGQSGHIRMIQSWAGPPEVATGGERQGAPAGKSRPQDCPDRCPVLWPQAALCSRVLRISPECRLPRAQPGVWKSQEPPSCLQLVLPLMGAPGSAQERLLHAASQWGP